MLPELKVQSGKSELFRYEIRREKLFISLPKTCFTFADIVEADTRVKWVGNLPELKMNRGGIKERVYKHSVHKIEMPRHDGTVEGYHFILEHATHSGNFREFLGMFKNYWEFLSKNLRLMI